VTDGHTRKSVVRRGLLLLGGAVGLGAGAGVAVANRSDEGSEQTIKLEGHAWRLTTPGRRLGDRVEPGDASTVHGEFRDRAGNVVGSFLGSRVAAPSTGGGLVADSSLELHTFKLADGTILGMGSSILGESVFSVVGGTGRYAGARGSYTAKQGIHELGGDGTASFELNLTA
jgi:hypothetical protein